MIAGASTLFADSRVKPDNLNLSSILVEFISTRSKDSIISTVGTLSTNSLCLRIMGKATWTFSTLIPICGGLPLITNVQTTDISSLPGSNPLTVSIMAGTGGIIGPASASLTRASPIPLALVGLPPALPNAGAPAIRPVMRVFFTSVLLVTGTGMIIYSRLSPMVSLPSAIAVT